MTERTHQRTDSEQPDGWTSGPSGTKVIRTEAAAKATKAQETQHSGLKVFPLPPADDDAPGADADEDANAEW